jgi:hypothetical protein
MTAPKPKSSAKPKAKAGLKFATGGAKHKTGKPFHKVVKDTAAKAKLKASPAPSPHAQAPLADDQIGPVPGIPTEAEIEQQVGSLASSDRAVLDGIRQLVAQHLGSFAAARLWLVTPGEGYEGTPLDTIRDGRGQQILDALTAQWGKNPTYA